MYKRKRREFSWAEKLIIYVAEKQRRERDRERNGRGWKYENLFEYGERSEGF